MKCISVEIFSCPNLKVSLLLENQLFSIIIIRFAICYHLSSHLTPSGRVCSHVTLPSVSDTAWSVTPSVTSTLLTVTANSTPLLQYRDSDSPPLEQLQQRTEWEKVKKHIHNTKTVHKQTLGRTQSQHDTTFTALVPINIEWADYPYTQNITWNVHA